MLEFIFFHLNICKLFTRFAEQLGVEYEIKDDGETITTSMTAVSNSWRMNMTACWISAVNRPTVTKAKAARITRKPAC